MSDADEAVDRTLMNLFSVLRRQAVHVVEDVRRRLHRRLRRTPQVVRGRVPLMEPLGGFFLDLVNLATSVRSPPGGEPEKTGKNGTAVSEDPDGQS